MNRRAIGLLALGMCTAGAMAQPANDLCANAELISISSGASGSIAGDNTTATDDAGLPACGLSTSAASGAKGVWYTFIGTGNRVAFDTCGGALDLTLRVYCGSCSTPVCAASDDDGCDTNSLAPKLALCTTPGTQYWVLLSRFGTAAGGAYTLNWSDSGSACPSAARPSCAPTAPVNDEICGAIPMSIGSSVIGTNVDATAESVPLPTCSFSGAVSVWYSFVGNGSTVTATTCNAITGSNTRVQIFTGSCVAPTCVSGNAAGTPACGDRNDAASTVALCTVLGQTYFVAVSTEANGTGLFQLTLTSSTCVPPPANDNCTGATPVALNVTQFVDTLQATNESPTPPTCNGLSTFNLGVWYTYTEGATAHRVTATTCDASTNFNTRVYAYSGSCGALTCITANATASPACAARSDAAAVTFCTTPGTQYFFLVTNDTTGTGTVGFTLVDTGIGCSAPPNDTCATATPVTSVPFNSLVSADTAGNDLPDVSCNAAAATDSRAGVWYHYTPSEPGRFSFVENGTGDVVFTVFTGGCGSLTEVFCNTNETGTVFFQASAGTQYYILVSMASNTATLPGTYDIQIRYTADAGACCVGTSCSVTNGMAACTALGGSFQGYGASCGGGPLAANRNTTSTPIPDFPTGGPVNPASTSINVTDTSVITDVDVYVNIDHSFGGDIYIRVTGPNGVTVDLLKRPNIAAPCTAGVIGDADDLLGTYIFDDQAAQTLHNAFIDADTTVIIAPGRYQAATCTGTPTSLNASGTGFGGISAAGNWTLTVSDEDEAIVGTLLDWGIVINGVEANTPCTTGSTGRCCVGARCTVGGTMAQCVSGGGSAGASFTPSAANCNASGTFNGPCCFADYNKAGGVTVQDIFDFLTDWFGGNINATVGGTGAPPTVQSIFDFLTAWFAGGC